MTRRLFYLNALLLLIAVVLGMRLRMLWTEARNREEMVGLNARKRATYSAKAPTPQVQAINAGGYAEVESRLLFAKDRSPLVIAPPALPPPPPPPQPPFPKANGVMMLSEPRIILSARGNDQKIYKFGDKVGEWEIVKFDSRQITLKWMDKEVTKDLSDLADAAPIPAPQQVTPPVSGNSPSVAVKGGGDSASTPGTPGEPLGNGTAVCAPGDNSPGGTISNGMKKVIVANPFGFSCRWDPVK